MGPIVLFDGVCNLCSGSVNFIIRRDTGRVLRFASLQSDVSRRILAEHGSECLEPNSVILIEDGRVLDRSDAALGIARHLGIPWSWFAALKIVPRAVRDLFYGIVARNRYRIFGRRSECMIPTPELRERFLD